MLLALRAADKQVRDSFFSPMTQQRLAKELEERKLLRVLRSREDETYV